MRYKAERGRWGRAAALAALALIASGCAAVQQTQSQASPSDSPSASPAESPSALPSPVALRITTAAFHSGEVALSYTPVTLGAAGGVGLRDWTLAAGALPGGLSLSSDGSVTGKPTAAGTFRFTLRVADSAGGTAAVARSIGIFPALKVSLIPACATQCSVEIGCVTVCGKFGTVAGGSRPYRYALAGGYVPTGTSLSALSLVGTFSGSPSRYPLQVSVTDALGVSRTIAPTFYVFPHISLANGTCSISVMTCKVQLRYLGGTPGKLPTVKPTAWAAVCNYTLYPAVCAPQPTFSATYQAGLVTITLTVSPTSPNTGTMNLLITDKNLCGAGTYCSSKATLTVA